jgi:hypothetical protein
LPESVVEVGDVIFNGTECNVSGPIELPPGRYSYVLKDLSEDDVTIFVGRLTAGKTFQDILDLQSEPGEYFPWQDWIKLAIESGVAWNKPDGGEVHTYIFNSEGEYVVGLGSTSPAKRWFCAPFWVKEDSSD